jgi:hypothetical protein
MIKRQTLEREPREANQEFDGPATVGLVRAYPTSEWSIEVLSPEGTWTEGPVGEIHIPGDGKPFNPTLAAKKLLASIRHHLAHPLHPVTTTGTTTPHIRPITRSTHTMQDPLIYQAIRNLTALSAAKKRGDNVRQWETEVQEILALIVTSREEEVTKSAHSIN